jgi:kinesin family protein 20
MSTEINSALSQSSKNLFKVLEETLPPITNILNSSFQNEKTINTSISESPKKKLNEQNDSIKTFCRIRPFNGINLLFHRSKTDPKILNVNSENLQKLNINTNLKLINSYKFSKVFTEENTQIEIFNETCKNLIDDLVFNHKSGLIFTFGMTNAGKTFTVIGSPNNPGILPQSLILFFDYFQNKQLNDYNLFCNFVEIYNDEVFDLLSNDETGKNKFYKKKLNVKENLNNIFYLPDVTYQKLNSLKDFNDSLNLGVSKKVHSSTNLNQNSSRSHSIFKIILKKENENYQNNNILEQEISLSIVDLAGSERAKRTDTSGKELQEACKINQSLSILGKCLEAMKHNSLFTQKKLVPFRESKLTKLFCEYFQGEQNIIMITNINPRKEDFEESIRALNYSCLAKDIRPIKSVLNINNKN